MFIFVAITNLPPSVTFPCRNLPWYINLSMLLPGNCSSDHSIKYKFKHVKTIFQLVIGLLHPAYLHWVMWTYYFLQRRALSFCLHLAYSEPLFVVCGLSPRCLSVSYLGQWFINILLRILTSFDNKSNMVTHQTCNNIA